MKLTTCQFKSYTGKPAPGLIFLLMLMTTLSGCSKDEKKAVRFSKPATDKTTTQTVTAGSENQTEFIVERYLPQDERLRRRQARISAVLDAPAE